MVYLKLNKKGLAWYTVVTMILIVVAGGILIVFFTTKLGPWMKERSDKEICRLSVLAMTKIKPGGKPITGLRCKTQRVVIDGKNVDDVNEQIANLLYDCWWQFGEGKLNIAPERWINPFSKKHCFVCSVFGFSDDAKKIYKEETLSSWMNEHTLPSKKITYEEYFKRIEEGEDYILIDSDVNPNEKYAIIFVASEQAYLKKLRVVLFFGSFAIEKIIKLFEKNGIDHEGLLMLSLKRKNIEDFCDVLE